ncbi:MAG: hypothetical protein KAT05_00750 [Spirochaetes bacterium]|nr:hypothetical protein [Spirochaetota bacterium]
MSEILKRKKIEISFRKFVDYSNDVLKSDYNTFSTRLKILIHHCENDPVMKIITNQLKNIDVDFDGWMANSMESGGSMAGSKEFNLPVDETERDALLYQFCLKINTEEIDIMSYSIHFFGGDNFNDYVNSINDAIVKPLVRSISYKIEEINDTIDSDLEDKQDVPRSMLIVYQNHSTNIEGNVTIEGDAAIGTSAEIRSNNEFKGDTVIGQNSKIEKNKYVIDNSVEYNIDKKNVIFTERASIYLTNTIGEKKVRISGVISLIAGLIQIFTWLNSLVPDIKIIPYMPAISNSMATWLLYSGLAFLLIGGLLLRVLKYHSSSQCKNCKKHYAYKEIGTPTIKELGTSKGIRKTTTRYYKCKFCGDKDVSEYTVFIDEKSVI